MKTTLYITALVLAGALVSCQKDAVEPDAASAGIAKTTGTTITPGPTAMTVHYQVGIYQQFSAPLCGVYKVVITNSAGVIVAPAQNYIPSQVNYFFTETVTRPWDVRVARLLASSLPEDGAYCRNRLSTHPDKESIQFADGKAYFFYLYPSYSQSQIPH